MSKMNDNGQNSGNQPPGGMPQKLTPAQLQQLMALQQLMQSGAGAPPGMQIPGAGAGLPQQAPKKLSLRQIFTNILQFMQNSIQVLDRFVNLVVKKTDADRNDVVQAARAPILFGSFIIIIFVGIGGLWSAIAPLDSAAHAMAVVITDTNKKTIQHQEGGIIKNIFVRPGEHIKTGDKLIELDETRIRSQYENILNQYRTTLATESRLIAERDAMEEIDFPDFLKKDTHVADVEKLITTQENLFRSRRQEYNAEKESIRQRISQLHKNADSLEARKVSFDKNKQVSAERLKSTKALFDKGFANKATLLQLEAQDAEIKSQLSAVDSEIIKNEQEITRAELELINLQNKYTTRTLNELKETQVNVGSLEQQFVTLTDALNRSVIKSPVDGTVNKINFHTIGGTIPPHAEILEISPENESLVLEAKVPSQNIDSVHEGLLAKIRFNAFKSRTTPVFTGKVVSISPDVVIDRNMPTNPQTYYVARIELDMDEFNQIAAKQHLKLLPGMQADVNIVVGTRTLLQYLLDPVIDTMFKAFKER